MVFHLPAFINLVSDDHVLFFNYSNPPLSEEMLPPGEWMCHRCNVRKKVSGKASLLHIKCCHYVAVEVQRNISVCFID